MVELKNVYSNSRPGLSIIKVDIKSNYWSDRLPQVWDVLRKKVQDIEPSLPPGAGKPKVGDDFGYVFGFLLAVSSDAYSYAELERHVKDMRKELSVVPGVARVDLWGVQEKRIYIDVSTAQLTELNLTPEQIRQTLQSQNLVVDAGRVDYETQRLRVAPTGEFQSPRRHRRSGDHQRRCRARRDRSHPRFFHGFLRVRGPACPALAPQRAAGHRAGNGAQRRRERGPGRAGDRPPDRRVGRGPSCRNRRRACLVAIRPGERVDSAFMISLLEAVAIVLALLALSWSSPS